MKKLALLAAAIATVLLGVHLWGSHTTSTAPVAPAASTTAPAPRPATTAPTAPSATATPTTSAGPYGGTEEARRAWEPIVQGFALAYPDTAGLTRTEWLANLRPYLDRPVVDALSTTDLDKVPHGHYAGYQLLKVADEAVTIRVTYQEGWALVLYLAATGEVWEVVAFDATNFD